ncbi:MAG: tyrosine--tRNA ligase [Candidatus Omnitrophica bacterium]|nr:tyrosine--tRNA ligase [Candidatus Omnitrophota bacterium]
MLPAQEQLNIIKRGADEVIEPGELKEKLSRGKPLVIKAGFDPSAPDLHLGHTVLLRKLKHFQELGHDVHFLIGDFTGRIGDPSGKSKTRKQLTEEEVKENAKTYKKQIFKILDKEKTKVVFNSEWCSKLGAAGMFDLASRYTVARMLERDDFSKRYAAREPISIIEFLYPLLQGYDSVHMKADVELGGTDQKFNLLVGRDLQRNFGQEPQVILTMPILEGLYGGDKMSKSLNNYVGIDEAPEEMFGKLMSISDELMWKYYELLTDIDVMEVKGRVEKGELHPKKAKSDLAVSIITEYWGQDKAEGARTHFETVFAKKELPDNIEETVISGSDIIICDAVSNCFKISKSEARRKIEEGAVSLDGDKITDIAYNINLDNKIGKILKLGKRRFMKLIGK